VNFQGFIVKNPNGFGKVKFQWVFPSLFGLTIQVKHLGEEMVWSVATGTTGMGKTGIPAN